MSYLRVPFVSFWGPDWQKQLVLEVSPGETLRIGFWHCMGQIFKECRKGWRWGLGMMFGDQGLWFDIGSIVLSCMLVIVPAAFSEEVFLFPMFITLPLSYIKIHVCVDWLLVFLFCSTGQLSTFTKPWYLVSVLFRSVVIAFVLMLVHVNFSTSLSITFKNSFLIRIAWEPYR